MSKPDHEFVAYYRVSTIKQGASGLGLAAQRSAILAYLNGCGRIVAEFTEIESGRKSNRPALEQALSAARVRRTPIVVAKVDRLTRSVGFLSRLLEAGVDVRFADLPSLEGPTGRFMLQQMAAVAELEAGLISSRTKSALAAAKARGIHLGGHRGSHPSQAAHRASIEVSSFVHSLSLINFMLTKLRIARQTLNDLLSKSSCLSARIDGEVRGSLRYSWLS